MQYARCGSSDAMVLSAPLVVVSAVLLSHLALRSSCWVLLSAHSFATLSALILASKFASPSQTIPDL